MVQQGGPSREMPLTGPSAPQPLEQYLARIELLLEGGLYRQTLDAIATALEHYPYADSLWLWQAIATEAAGDTETAIATAQPLTNSQDAKIRQQSRYLIEIWSAPKLERPQNWAAGSSRGDRLISPRDDGKGDRVPLASTADTPVATAAAKPRRDSEERSVAFPFWRTLLFIGATTLVTACLLTVLSH